MTPDIKGKANKKQRQSFANLALLYDKHKIKHFYFAGI